MARNKSHGKKWKSPLCLVSSCCIQVDDMKQLVIEHIADRPGTAEYALRRPSQTEKHLGYSVEQCRQEISVV
jgi:hypothetical protein